MQRHFSGQRIVFSSNGTGSLGVPQAKTKQNKQKNQPNLTMLRPYVRIN